MLSRVAGRLYWMARYLERAESTARLVNVYGTLMLDLPRGTGLHWRQLVEIAGSDEQFRKSYRSDGESNVLKFMAADAGNPTSLISSLTYARENVRTSRDLMPSRAWECINELYLYGRRRLPSSSFRKNRRAVLSEVIALCQQIHGILASSMSHGVGYQFVRLGRNIERADMTTRIVDVGSASLHEDGEEGERLSNRLWMNVLLALSAHQMYRQNVKRGVHREDVIKYLIKDPELPRSVTHALIQAGDCVNRLPRKLRVKRAINRLKNNISGTQLDALSGRTLNRYLDDLQSELGTIHDAVTDTWFSRNQQ